MTPSFSLTEKQAELRSIFGGAAKYLLVYGGSRSGKTFFIIYAILTRMMMAPNSRHVVFRQDGVDAKQSIGNETVPEVVRLAFPGLHLRYDAKDGYFQAPNGSQLWLAGLKDKQRLDKVLGKEYATIYINEASQVAADSFRVVETRLAQTAQRVDGKPLDLRFYVDLNPTVTTHWTYKIWVEGKMPEDGTPVPDWADDYRHCVVNPADNADNLPASYLRSLQNLPERMRRRFWQGGYTADDDNALWRRTWVQIDEPAEIGRTVIAVDPATTNNPGSDETGIIVAGMSGGRAYVLADESGKFRPEKWARRVVSLYDTFGADKIVAEANQGGQMVQEAIRAQSSGRTLPVQLVHATKGKHVRAEPIAGLYEQGRIRHAEPFPELVDQMCSFVINMDRKEAGYSPDRVDALVWAMASLFPEVAALNKRKQRSPVSIPAMVMPGA